MRDGLVVSAPGEAAEEPFSEADMAKTKAADACSEAVSK